MVAAAHLPLCHAVHLPVGVHAAMQGIRLVQAQIVQHDAQLLVHFPRIARNRVCMANASNLGSSSASHMELTKAGMRILTAIEVQQPHQLDVRLPVGPEQNHAERRVNAQRRKDFGGFVAGLQYGGAHFLCELQHIFGQLIGNGGVEPGVCGQPVQLLLTLDRRYGGRRQQRKQSEFR